MKKQDLQFSYPEHLVATEPGTTSRVLWGSDPLPCEMTLENLLEQFQPGDLLVLNDTQVLKRRVFAGNIEILFLEPLATGLGGAATSAQDHWQVLFPSRSVQLGENIALPGGVQMKLLAKGLPQTVSTSKPLSEAYFEQYGELPLPPYIQKARGLRHQAEKDVHWYQSVWAKEKGSFAAPTASLHFREAHLQLLRERGVQVLFLTLHVGLGTFLPVKVDDLNSHNMHEEEYGVPRITCEAITKFLQEKQEPHSRNNKNLNAKPNQLWALGTTVTRALESAALGGMFTAQRDVYSTNLKTKILIQPGFSFQVVDRLLTNFHQPESTLLALVSAFAGLEKVKSHYSWAIENQFRLFSYGDLSAW